MMYFINAAIDKVKQVYNTVAKRLEPVINAGKLAYIEILKSAKASLKAAKSGLKATKSAVNVANSLAKAGGNTARALGYDLPSAAYSHYHAVPERTARSFEDAANDLSAAGANICQAATDAVETGSLALDFIKDSAAACDQTAKAACNTGEFLAETAMAAFDGTQVVYDGLTKAGSLAYAYTPSYESIKAVAASLSNVIRQPLAVAAAEAPSSIELASLAISAPAA